jgi:hypothetical protein
MPHNHDESCVVFFEEFRSLGLRSFLVGAPPKLLNAVLESLYQKTGLAHKEWKQTLDALVEKQQLSATKLKRLFEAVISSKECLKRRYEKLNDVDFRIQIPLPHQDPDLSLKVFGQFLNAYTNYLIVTRLAKAWYRIAYEELGLPLDSQEEMLCINTLFDLDKFEAEHLFKMKVSKLIECFEDTIPSEFSPPFFENGTADMPEAIGLSSLDDFLDGPALAFYFYYYLHPKASSEASSTDTVVDSYKSYRPLEKQPVVVHTFKNLSITIDQGAAPRGHQQPAKIEKAHSDEEVLSLLVECLLKLRTLVLSQQKLRDPLIVKIQRDEKQRFNKEMELLSHYEKSCRQRFLNSLKREFVRITTEASFKRIENEDTQVQSERPNPSQIGTAREPLLASSQAEPGDSEASSSNHRHHPEEPGRVTLGSIIACLTANIANLEHDQLARNETMLSLLRRNIESAKTQRNSAYTHILNELHRYGESQDPRGVIDRLVRKDRNTAETIRRIKIDALFTVHREMNDLLSFLVMKRCEALVFGIEESGPEGAFMKLIHKGSLLTQRLDKILILIRGTEDQALINVERMTNIIQMYGNNSVQTQDIENLLNQTIEQLSQQLSLNKKRELAMKEDSLTPPQIESAADDTSGVSPSLTSFERWHRHNEKLINHWEEQSKSLIESTFKNPSTGAPSPLPWETVIGAPQFDLGNWETL